MTEQVLAEGLIPELHDHYRGKVRDNYNIEGDRRIIITTDRLSAFDRAVCAVPEKGRILTETAEFWFNKTRNICPNHCLSWPDPNVLVAKKLRMLPVEIVVRDYLAGTTSTSLLSMYKENKRTMYGIQLPDGLRANEMLPQTIITPTTKSDQHDDPLSPREVVERGLMTQPQWDQVEGYAFALFAYGRYKAQGGGLILVDTKYEFGLDENDRIVLADEIHTPDSSRYWFADAYEEAFEAGQSIPSFDKDVVRRWISARCDPYRDELPVVPDEVIEQTTKVYVDAYERITGLSFQPTHLEEASILDRVRDNLWKHDLL